MKLDKYIAFVIQDFVEAQGDEVTGIRQLDFDIGLDAGFRQLNGESIAVNYITVNDKSANRIRFTLEVKRS